MILKWLRKKSGTPLVYKMGWWPYQKGLSISDLQAESVQPKLNLFSHYFLMKYHISGSLSERPGFRPFIEAVNINEKWNEDRSQKPHGEIILIPIVAVKEDSSYHGEAVPFEVTVQDRLSTKNWGENLYTVIAGSKSSSLVLLQGK